MRRPTTLMTEILQSPTAQRMIDFIAPIYGDSYVGLWLLQVIGLAMDEAGNYARSLVNEVIPHTVDWTISYWEEEYNTTPDPSWTLEQRRANLLAKIKYVPPVNPAKLAEYASAASGVPCEVIENVDINTFAIEMHGHTNALARLIAIVDQAKPAHLIWQARGIADEVSLDFRVGTKLSARVSRTTLKEV